MDTLGHTLMGGELVAVALLRMYRKKWMWWVVAISAFFGALPDVIGAYGNWMLHDHWALYNSAHSGAIYDVLRWIPSYFLHCLVDTAMHGVNAWWVLWTPGFFLEILLWIAILMFLYHIVLWIKDYER